MKLEEIKAREKAATPGPWRDTIDGLIAGRDTPLMEFTTDEDGAGDWHIDGCEFSAANTEFIIHAREDIPALTARVEELQNENLSFHAQATDYYEETVRLKAQLEAEILRRDSLDETLKSARAEVERLRERGAMLERCNGEKGEYIIRLEKGCDESKAEVERREDELAIIRVKLKEAAERGKSHIKIMQIMGEKYQKAKAKLAAIRKAAEPVIRAADHLRNDGCDCYFDNDEICTLAEAIKIPEN